MQPCLTLENVASNFACQKEQKYRLSQAKNSKQSFAKSLSLRSLRIETFHVPVRTKIACVFVHCILFTNTRMRKIIV